MILIYYAFLERNQYFQYNGHVKLKQKRITLKLHFHKFKGQGEAYSMNRTGQVLKLRINQHISHNAQK